MNHGSRGTCRNLKVTILGHTPYFSLNHDFGSLKGRCLWMSIEFCWRVQDGCQKWSYNPYKWPYKWLTGVITTI